MYLGWETWTRTTIDGVKVRCPTIRRSPNFGVQGGTRTHTTEILSLLTLPIGLPGHDVTIAHLSAASIENRR